MCQRKNSYLYLLHYGLHSSQRLRQTLRMHWNHLVIIIIDTYTYQISGTGIVICKDRSIVDGNEKLFQT